MNSPFMLLHVRRLQGAPTPLGGPQEHKANIIKIFIFKINSITHNFYYFYSFIVSARYQTSQLIYCKFSVY